MKRDIIFDMDGTLCDTSKRQHYLQGPRRNRNWVAFKEEAIQDAPHNDVIWLARLLKEAGCRLVICTARTEEEREVTVQWLKEVGKCYDLFDKIYMRANKDYRDDADIKLELLEQIRADGYDPYMVFDDRDRVVNAWRNKAKLRCMQVNHGDF